MYRSTYNGYEVDWKENTSIYSKIMYDGVRFHRIFAEFNNASFTIKLRAEVSPHSNTNTNKLIIIGASFSKELLENFGIDICDSKVIKDENFIPNIIKITSQMNYWHTRMHAFINSQTVIPASTNTSYPKAYYYTENLDVNKENEYKEQLKIKDELIEDLRMEIQDLKDEIETLKAIALDA